MSAIPARTMPNNIVVRTARPRDCAFVWRVNNQPFVRAQAINTKSIPYATHCDWYRAQITRNDSILLIGIENKKAFGVVRFDLDRPRREAVVTVAVCRDRVSSGLGTMLICVATDQVFNKHVVERIVALVRPGNTRSRKAFERAGFTAVGTTTNRGAALLVFELQQKPDGQ